MMKLLLLLASAIAVLTSVLSMATPEKCPGWVDGGPLLGSILIVNTLMPYDDAVENCEYCGGELLVLCNLQMRIAIINIAPKNTWYWVGAQNISGTWEWHDKCKVSGGWNVNYPKKTNGDCIAINNVGSTTMFSNYPCTRTFGSICQKFPPTSKG